MSNYKIRRTKIIDLEKFCDFCKSIRIKCDIPLGNKNIDLFIYLEGPRVPYNYTGRIRYQDGFGLDLVEYFNDHANIEITELEFRKKFTNFHIKKRIKNINLKL